jgi:nucleoid-associated protein YgaU
MNRVKKPIRTIALLVATLAILASCASKPKVPATEPVPATTTPAVVEPAPATGPAIAQEDLDKLLAQAKELKKKAFDLKLFEVLPDDYKAADALLAQGQKAYDDKAAEEAKKGLDSAITAYKDLISRGVIDIAQAKRKDAEAIKATAIKAGADSSQVERFGAGDEAFTAADALLSASKAEESIPGFEKALLYYELSWKRAVASDLRAGIEDKDFAQWDSGNFQLADNKYQAEDGFWASGNEVDRASGVDALDEAILRFNLVVQKGREMGVSTVKDKTDAEKQRSEDIKANVAVKDKYDAAMELYNEGAAKLAAKEYEAAAEAYDKSGSGFSEAYKAAAEKRAKAAQGRGGRSPPPVDFALRRKSMKKYLLLLIAMIAVSSLALGAQSLKDNPNYQKSLELSAQAKQAFDDGDYDAATEYANQAKEFAALSDRYVDKMLAKAQADKDMAKAKDRLAWADGVNAKAGYPELYDKAAGHYADAQSAYGEENYPTASDDARAALAALDGIAAAIADAAALAAAKKDAWPAVYVVRLIPARRDCLWRIAEYPYIYNNPLKWPVIYEANKKNFRDPGNPNLIFPGQKLQIPAIKGESRDGTYDPAKTYKAFPRK